MGFKSKKTVLHIGVVCLLVAGLFVSADNAFAQMQGKPGMNSMAPGGSGQMSPGGQGQGQMRQDNMGQSGQGQMGQGQISPGGSGRMSPGGQGQMGQGVQGQTGQGKMGQGGSNKMSPGSSGQMNQGVQGQTGQGVQGQMGQGVQGQTGQGKMGQSGQGQMEQGSQGRMGQGQVGSGKSGQTGQGQMRQDNMGQGGQGQMGQGVQGQGQMGQGVQGQGQMGQGQSQGQMGQGQMRQDGPGAYGSGQSGQGQMGQGQMRQDGPGAYGSGQSGFDSGRPGDMGRRGDMMQPDIERLKDVQMKNKEILQEKQQRQEFKMEDKKEALDRFRQEDRANIEGFIEKMDVQRKHIFNDLSENMSEMMKEKLVEKIDRPEYKEELKDFMGKAGSFIKEQAQEYLGNKLDLMDKEREFRSGIMDMKDKMKGLKNELEELDRQRERFIENQNFIGDNGQKMKEKLEDMVNELKKENVTDGAVRKKINDFKREAKQIIRENFQERLERGDVPFPDTPDDGNAVIEKDGTEKQIPGHDPAFFEHIKKLKDRGVVKGFSDGTFQPGARVKAAELLKMAVGAAGEEVNYDSADPGAVGGADGLEDSPKWHRILYNKAKEIGVLEEDDKQPNREATRAETVRWVLRSYGIPVQQGLEKKFNDVSTNHPDIDAIATAKKLGIVKGVSDTAFLPDGPVSRAEMAKIISNTEEALSKINPETGEILERAKVPVE